MATKLTKIVADFSTTLAVKLSVAGESATLVGITDDDGNTLPNGKYFFTLDGGTSSKEHIYCTLTGTALSLIKSVSRQGVHTTGAVREHRAGATVSLTDFAIIKELTALLSGETDLDADHPLKYDAEPTLSDDNEITNKKYVDDSIAAGASNASTTVKGVVEEATQAEVDAKTGVGGTGAQLFVNPANLRPANINDYVASDIGAADAYAIITNPVISAYAEGQVFIFKAANANTGASTLAVCGLATKPIKKNHDIALVAGDIEAGQTVVVTYDGTNMQMVSPVGADPASLYILLSNLDVTTTLGTSDTKVPSQKAVKSYVDTQVATKQKMISSPSGRSTNTTYQESSDGFIVCDVVVPSSGTKQLTIKSDASSTPTTVVLDITGADGQRYHICFPIKKSNYWVLANNACTISNLNFIAFGS